MQVKISMFQNMSSKTPPGRSTHRLPEIFPPAKRTKASERIEFPNGVYAFMKPIL